MSNQRIPLVEPPYSAELQSAFNVVMPEGVPPLNIFRTVANNSRVLSRMTRGGLLDRGSISIAQRELVILRTCGLCRAEYEWGVHVALFADKAGFNREQVAATASGDIDSTLWSDEQVAILRLTDELYSTSRVSDETWALLLNHFNHEQLVELVMLAGLYHAVSFVVNAFQVERESFSPQFT